MKPSLRPRPAGKPVSWLTATLVAGLAAQGANLLPNPSFTEGSGKQPAGWVLSGGTGAWNAGDPPGQRVLRIDGTGHGSSAWHCSGISLAPGQSYRLSFRGQRGTETHGGCHVAGPSRVNRDFQLSPSWQPHSFVFAAPEDAGKDTVRLGQWETTGPASFDDVELLPVLTSQRRVCGTGTATVFLGEGESVAEGVYRFRPDFGWEGSNCHRPLWRNRASFNSDRWILSGSAEVIYHFSLPGITQSAARVRICVNHHTAGQLQVDASRDAVNWHRVGVFDPSRLAGTDALPPALFPATGIFLRLSLVGASGNLQFNACDYEADLAADSLPAPLHQPVSGHTRFAEVLVNDATLGLESFDASTTLGGGWVELALAVRNRSAGALSLTANLTAAGLHALPVSRATVAATPGAVVPLTLRGRVTEPGTQQLECTVAGADGNTLLRARTTAVVGFLHDPRAGHRLPAAGATRLWWCEGAWKLAADAPPDVVASMPESPAVSVSLARGEDEPAQVFVAPARDASLTAIKPAVFRSANGTTARLECRIDEIGYLEVTRPTDGSATPGRYPDPLPPLRLPRPVPAGQTLPLWLTFHAPRDTPAGDFTGSLELRFDTGPVRVPLAIRVHAFELPRETHLKSAFGLGTGEINQFHGLSRQDHREQVFEHYLANFAAHRISPYSFFDHAPIQLRFDGEGSEKHAVVDFAKFDAAATKWLDQHHFGTFRLPLQGMGGGTFHSRSPGSLEGFPEGSPEFARLFQDYVGQVEKHLRQRGWLDKAYVYWFDEPDPKDYPFVIEGMKRIRAAAPGLRRMLTEQPEPSLLGNVEIWCGLTPEWTPEKVQARRAAGEEVWWYVCTGPKAPYLTLFLDHPGIEMRLWPWQSWQYGVQGILVWSTTYWTSDAAFPPPRRQDPWTDPMGYVSGYSYQPGQVGYWGNGDGRFLYPPRRLTPDNPSPCLDPPVNSIRWENLRDGMEDYEYFWLLERVIDQAAKAGATPDSLAATRALLRIPPEISTDLTRFTTDPRLLLAHRAKIARAIEKWAAFSRNQPR